MTQLLSHAAMGELPSERELDALQLPPATRRKVSEAATVVVGIKTGGANKQARDHAQDRADQIVAGLPGEYRDPDYLKPADETPDDPAGLADLVARR